MSSPVTPPRSGIPIGYVVIGGKQVPAELHPEFRRLFESFFVRIGGVSGSSSDDLTLAQFEDAGIEETKALLTVATDAFQQFPPHVSITQDDVSPSLVISAEPEDQSAEISALRAEVERLRVLVDSLLQGNYA